MMASEGRRRLVADRIVKDIEPGDLVRQKGSRGTGLVESISGDHATVAWDGNRKSILPLAVLRRARGVGGQFDTRRNG